MVMSERINGMTQQFSGQMPGQVPSESAEGKMEYYVAALHSPEALELEEKLNEAGKNGWSLFQIIQQSEELLLLFFRRSQEIG